MIVSRGFEPIEPGEKPKKKPKEKPKKKPKEKLEKRPAEDGKSYVLYENLPRSSFLVNHRAVTSVSTIGRSLSTFTLYEAATRKMNDF